MTASSTLPPGSAALDLATHGSGGRGGRRPGRRRVTGTVTAARAGTVRAWGATSRLRSTHGLEPQCPGALTGHSVARSCS